MSLETDGFCTYSQCKNVVQWSAKALTIIQKIATNPSVQAQNLRHQSTWFVGVDVLPNDANGALDCTPLIGPWRRDVPQLPLHRAQVSIIYPGYPKQDPDESDANHSFRRNWASAHVDGLLPFGPDKRRFATEFHAYILGLPLNKCAASPTVVWRGSHVIMQRALTQAIGSNDPATVDVTMAYQTARREVFETCERVDLIAKPGEAFLLHRFALHGVAPWENAPSTGKDGRMIAFFRPEFSSAEWLAN
jgi:hypothetical protein